MFFFKRGYKELDEAKEQLEEAKRARAFAAGYRCGQLAILTSLSKPDLAAPLVEWEKDEAENAVKQGFPMASPFCRIED